MSEHSLTIELPIRPASAREARDALRSFSAPTGDSAVMDAQLIVSELVADAVACAAEPEVTELTLGAEFRGWGVPEVLLSCDHGKIEEWRREQSRQRTAS